MWDNVMLASPHVCMMCHAWHGASLSHTWHTAFRPASFVPRVGADQLAAVCGRLLRALLRIDRFVVPHDQVYCLCAQPIRVSTRALLRIMRDIKVPVVLIKVRWTRPHSPRVAPAG